MYYHKLNALWEKLWYSRNLCTVMSELASLPLKQPTTSTFWKKLIIPTNLDVNSSTVCVWKLSSVTFGPVRSSPTDNLTSSLLPEMSLTLNQMTIVSPSVKFFFGMLMTTRSCVGGTVMYSGGADNPIPPAESTTNPTEYPTIPVMLSTLSTDRRPKLRVRQRQ